MILKMIRLSFRSIKNNKMRSFLTMLGIIIGVMAVVILVSITQNAGSGITDSISDMGSELITASISDEDITITAEEIEELENFRTIENVAPVISTSLTAKHKTESSTYSIAGVTNEYFIVQDITVQSGREILDSDNDSKTNVAVIGTEVAEDLFGTWDAVGGTISIDSSTYKVVGVLEEQGSSLVGSDDSKILIPYTTAQRITGQTGTGTFYIKASDPDLVDAAINSVEAYLLQITRDEDSYTVSNQSDVLDTMSDVSNTMSFLLAGIAAISLLVGGIGIMNIMLVSVSERTREIGIRKAVGAKRRHIMFQFLCESCILSVLGGVIGLMLSYAGIIIYNSVTQSTAAMNREVGLAAIAFCAVIGILFGSYPAAKASGLQPIEALRTS